MTDDHALLAPMITETTPNMRPSISRERNRMPRPAGCTPATGAGPPGDTG